MRLEDTLYIGNMDARRDWGHAEDYVRAMWLMLQQPEPQDLVIATGVTATVREFVQKAFAETGIRLRFEGEGKQERGVIASIDPAKLPADAPQRQPGDVLIKVDPRYFRPTEVDQLQGDAAKARDTLGWHPEYTLDTLITDMIHADLQHAQKEMHGKTIAL